MVLLDGLAEGEQNKDNEEMDIQLPEEGSNADEHTNSVLANTDMQDEPDIEDMAAEEWIRLETE